MATKKNSLDKIELETAAEVEKRRKHGKISAVAPTNQTRVAKQIRKPKQANERPKKANPEDRQRRTVPRPKNKSLKEIHEMDPDDPAFKDKRGDKRKWDPSSPKAQIPITWRDEIKAHKQKKINDRRARVRKYEAEVQVAQETLAKHSNSADHAKDIYDEDRLIAEGIISLDEWDNEELIRGYRRNRNGKFGKAPQFVPREIQQEAFRRLVNRGERRMKQAYMEAIEQLINLAHSANSEKVKLEAIEALLERVVGKVPDKVLVAHDEPWQGILADSLVPLSEADPITLEPTPDGGYAMPALDAGTPSEMREGEVDA